MDSIDTIQELIEQFDDAEPAEQAKILKNIEIPTEKFKEYATWCEDGGYTRNCLARNEDFEFILLCWSAGAKTPIHGHAGQDCWVYQLDGKVKETRFQESDEGNLINDRELHLSEGDLGYMHDKMGYHNIENISNERAMTLHIYASPIDECRIFNEETEIFELQEMQYDTYHCEEIQNAVR